jgi:hypothetical protein
VELELELELGLELELPRKHSGKLFPQPRHSEAIRDH